MDPDWRCMDPIENGNLPASYVSLLEGILFMTYFYPPQKTDPLPFGYFESMIFLDIYPRYLEGICFINSLTGYLLESFYIDPSQHAKVFYFEHMFESEWVMKPPNFTQHFRWPELHSNSKFLRIVYTFYILFFTHVFLANQCIASWITFPRGREADFAKASEDASGLATEMEQLREKHQRAVVHGEDLERKMKEEAW